MAIKIFKLEKAGKKYIGVEREMESEIHKHFLRLPNVNFSKDDDCYWMPYARKNFKLLRALTNEVIVTERGTTDSEESLSEPTAIEGKPSLATISENVDISRCDREVVINWTGKYFAIKIPFQADNVAFIKRLEKSYWNAKYGNWIAKSSIKNLERLQKFFKVWDEHNYQKIEALIKAKNDPLIIELYATPEHVGRVIVKLLGHNVDVAYMKGISGRSYNVESKCWNIPGQKQVLNSLISHYAQRGYKVVNRIPKASDRSFKRDVESLANRIRKYKARYPMWMRGILNEYVSRLVLENYGWKTITSYTGKFVKFLDHFQGREVSELGVEEVNAFLALIAGSGASESLHNMYLSSIKFYYKKVCYKENFKLERLVRPRGGRFLPTILSITEVDKMFRSVTNLKHIALMYVIYSGGMRLGEILSLRISDIHWDRNQIHVRQGKGNKDRFTLLGEALKSVLRLYFDEYQPQYWLFEGVDRSGPYSERSVQNVVRNAARKAGISRRVTPHTLRHCFATHLLDSGTDVRYIQELLGHKDIKTTLVYTHVTTRSLRQIESPLDKLVNARGDKKNRNE